MKLQVASWVSLTQSKMIRRIEILKLMAELREQLGVANSSSETARTEQGISESETRLDLAEEERSEVLRIEQELKSAFETEYAGKLEEFLAGDALQRAKADAYLFGRAVAETDPSQRRLS